MLDIIFENTQILVVNKASGLVVNKSQTTKEQTLQDLIGDYFGLSKNELGIGDRAGIVHRLDRETSGVLVVAKTLRAFKKLQMQFKSREVQKKYISLVHGHLQQNEGIIEGFMDRVGKFGKFALVKKGGRDSQTKYLKISNYNFIEKSFEKLLTKGEFNKVRTRYLEANSKKYSLVEFYPKTGRTHQIRVHAKSIGHPVVSDLIYTPSKLLKFDLTWCPRLFLHAKSIEFRDPESGKIVEFQAKLPADLKGVFVNLTTEL